MSEHVEKGHPIGAVIMMLIITALVVLGIGAMNNDSASALLIVPFLGGYGLYVIFGLGKG